MFLGTQIDAPAIGTRGAIRDRTRLQNAGHCGYRQAARMPWQALDMRPPYAPFLFLFLFR
jgi:hypothetical protein